MADETIPADVGEFVNKYIDSVGALEALLLLRNSANTVWTTGGVAERLYLRENDVSDLLTALSEYGLLTRTDDGYQYDGREIALSQIVDRLEETYRRQLIPITNMIHSKPRRIRAFADAFKLKRDR